MERATAIERNKAANRKLQQAAIAHLVLEARRLRIQNELDNDRFVLDLERLEAERQIVEAETYL